ncbi:MAG: rubrerythrin family protein [Candidatus Bipolaricaulota bacterium]|nr:rubrerythrin family protein [Candidatus Bipolaricaulota bacterium]
MHAMTKEFLQAAFAGESQAHMKYLIFSQEAEKKKMPQLGRLFRAIAYAEQIHATNHFRELGKIGDAAANVQSCIEGENFEVTEMYPAYLATAELQGEKGAARSTYYALEAEKIHERMYASAKAAVAGGKDIIKLGPVLICPVCGYTVEGEALASCPVCGVKRETFKAF